MYGIRFSSSSAGTIASRFRERIPSSHTSTRSQSNVPFRIASFSLYMFPSSTGSWPFARIPSAMYPISSGWQKSANTWLVRSIP